MPPSVSVPEKTLEHWASQYVTYRYRSKAALWWPATGEDVDVRWLPSRPGKAVQLELKTSTVAGAGLHDVVVDLGQLWEYRQRRLGHQPFYAFPRPDWPGTLTAAATAGGRPVTELAFGRSGSGWWFADWMVVLTAAQVSAVLHAELAVHGSAKRGTKKRLVRFDLRRSGARPVVTWGSGTMAPATVGWRDFWPALEQCGRAGWPQLILLPAPLVPPSRRIPRARVMGMLRAAAAVIPDADWYGEDLVPLEPDEEGNFQVTRESRRQLGEPEDRAGDVEEDRRLLVFLDALTLLRSA
jgi:hypothetical protein